MDEGNSGLDPAGIRSSVAVDNERLPVHAQIERRLAGRGDQGESPDVLAEFLREAASACGRDEMGVAVRGEAVGVAIVTAGGAARRVGAEFSEWVGDPAESVACRHLARRAAGGAPAIGHVETLNHGVLAVLATPLASVRRWLLLAELLSGMAEDDGVALIVFAPSRSRKLVEGAARALGLSALQAGIAAALVTEPTLEAAAQALGVGRATAKDALDGALRRTGARRASELVGRLIDLGGNLAAPDPGDGARPYQTLGLSPTESRVAERLAAGDTLDGAAATLGLKPETVKSHRRSIFGKLGVNRAKDLRRLASEVAELSRLAVAGEVTPGAELVGETRVFSDPDGRGVACIDHGPPDGRPLIVTHGYNTGRLAPPPFLAACLRRGFRVIIPQRPGFGLTAPPNGDYLATAVTDAELILDGLGCRTFGVLARDGAVAMALALGARRVESLRAAVLLNPRSPRDGDRPAPTGVAAVTETLLRHPALIEPFTTWISRQTSRAAHIEIFRRVLAAAPSDARCFEDPAVVEHLLADTRGLVGRTTHGYIAENRLFAEGWRITPEHAATAWRILFSSSLAWAPNPATWAGIAKGPITRIEGAGLLAQFTHAVELVDILAEEWRDTPKRGKQAGARPG